MRKVYSRCSVVPFIFIVGCAANVSESDAPDSDLGAHRSNILGGLVDSIGNPLSDLTARIVTENAATDESFRLVARVEVQPQELVEFYEPAPGVIVISGAGAPAEGMMIDDSDDLARDPRLLWAAIAPGHAMPPKLGAAVERWVAVAQPEEQPQPQVPAPAPLRKSSPSDVSAAPRTTAFAPGWCDNEWWNHSPSGYGSSLGYCGGPYTYQVCLNNVTGNRAAVHDDGYDTKSNVCPFVGSVTFKLQGDEDWFDQGQWTVSTNNARWSRVIDSEALGDPFDDAPTIRVDILNASGDRYNFRFLVVPE